MTRDYIKQMAIELANEIGLINMTRAELCERAGIADGSFNAVLDGTFGELVAELAIEGHHGPTGAAVTRTRVNPLLRRAQILAAALDVAERVGYAKLSRAHVAEAARCSPALVSAHLGTDETMRSAIVTEAVQRGRVAVVAQAMADRHPAVADIPAPLRFDALRHLAGG